MTAVLVSTYLKIANIQNEVHKSKRNEFSKIKFNLRNDK